MNRLRALLQFLRIEEDGELSITNLFALSTLCLFIYSTVHGGTLDFAGTVSLLPALALYAHKKVLGQKAAATDAEKAEAADALETAVSKSDVAHDLVKELAAKFAALQNRIGGPR